MSININTENEIIKIIKNLMCFILSLLKNMFGVKMGAIRNEL